MNIKFPTRKQLARLSRRRVRRAVQRLLEGYHQYCCTALGANDSFASADSVKVAQALWAIFKPGSISQAGFIWDEDGFDKEARVMGLLLLDILIQEANKEVRA